MSRCFSLHLSSLLQQVLSVMYNDIWLPLVMAFYPSVKRRYWGCIMSPVFLLIPPLFYACGHSDLVQQMSPDVLRCVTGVLWIYIVCVCVALFNVHLEGCEFGCFSLLLFFPLLDCWQGCSFPSLGARVRQRWSMSLNACTLFWNVGSFSPLFFF